MRDEVKARSETILGTCLTDPALKKLDGTKPVWVCDVDVGAVEPVRDALVKGGSDGERFYAHVGMAVKLSRNTQGRFDVIGPSDRVAGEATVKTYTLASPTPVATTTVGLQTQRVAFEFYEGPTSGTPGTSLWNDGVNPFPLVRVVDQDGFPV